MSYALNKSGIKIPYAKGKTVSGADGNWYFYRVPDLQVYLTNLLGPPLQFTPQNWRQGIGGQAGILQFKNQFLDANGHFDLYDGRATIDGEDYSTRSNAQGVNFFPLNEIFS